MTEKNYFCRFSFGQFFTLLIIQIFTFIFIFYLGARFGNDILKLNQPALLEATDEQVVQNSIIGNVQDPEIQTLAKELIEASPTPDLKERVMDLLKRNQDEKQKEAELYKVKRNEYVDIVPANQESKALLYAVQVGSYPTEKEARQIVHRWIEKGYSAYLTQADLPGKGRWYRVRLGGFENKRSAGSYLKDLKKNESVDAIVVRND